ncbi:hypothetical protein GCM10027262_61600 [Nocardia tengchongensis]
MTFRAWTLSIRAISAVFGPLQRQISIRCGAGELIVERGGNQGAVIAPHSHVGSPRPGSTVDDSGIDARFTDSERRIVLDGWVDPPADLFGPPGLSSNRIVTVEMVVS